MSPLNILSMKKVIARQRVAENGRLVLGQGVHELPDAVADDLIKRGLVESADEKSTMKPVETATKEPEAETGAFVRRGRPRLND